jgi:tetratricopeptide (TPR) repeat protein
MKINYFSFFVLIAVLSVNILAQTDTTQKMDVNAAKYYNKSIESLKANNLKDAEFSIDSALAISHDSRIVYLKGEICRKMSNWNCAVKEYEEYITLDKTNDIAYIQLAAAYNNLKEYDKAIAVNKNLINVTKDPAKKSDAEGRIADLQQIKATELLNEGIDLNKAEKYDEALAKFNSSLEIKKDPKVYLQKGIVYSKMKNETQAITEINSAIAIDPNYDIAYYTLGGVYFGAKDFKNAISNYQKALDITTNDAVKKKCHESLKGLYFQAGAADFTAKKYDSAIENFIKSNEQVPYDQAYLWLGKSYTEKKKYEPALEAFDKADSIKTTVTEGAIAYYKGTLYKQKNDLDKALVFFKQSLSDKTYGKSSKSEIDYITAVKKQKK